MIRLLLINGHYPFPTSKGELNRYYIERARRHAEQKGFETRTVSVVEDWDIEEQVDLQLWADLIFLQFPLNSMSVPWRLKQYLDEVYTAGMDGRLAKGDGRTRSDPTRQYGSGGKMTSTRYMLSVTANAPKTAFNDPEQTLFAGKSMDELLSPVHTNFAFFGLSPVPSFMAFDVNKNPEFENDVSRFDAQIESFLSA